MRNALAPENVPGWEKRYRRKRAHRGRGLADLEKRVGAVGAAIEARFAWRAPVRVLELGCGYGIALLDLAARYGGRIETVGMNLREENGQNDVLQREAQARGIHFERHPAQAPSIVHGDIADGLPFTDDAFDVVVSQVAWRYFRNKIGVLREISRVLRDDGVAMIDADEFDTKLPAEYGRLVEIWDECGLVPFGDYAARFGFVLDATTHGRALRMTKAPDFGENLIASVEIDTTAIDPRWDGVKCVYRAAQSDERR